MGSDTRLSVATDRADRLALSIAMAGNHLSSGTTLLSSCVIKRPTKLLRPLGH